MVSRFPQPECQIRLKQARDQDTQQLSDAVAEASRWKARAWELERLLRATRSLSLHPTSSRQDHRPSLNDADEMRVHVPARSTSSNTGTPRPDLAYYQSVAEKAQKRVEVLERENLEASAECRMLCDGH